MSNTNYNLDKLEILERRIIRKILDPRKTSEGWKLRSNDEIYQSIETVSYTHLDVYKRQGILGSLLYCNPLFSHI